MRDVTNDNDNDINQVDDDGNWFNARQEDQYDSFHSYYESQLNPNQDNEAESIPYDQQVGVKQNKDEEFPVIASITTGCRVSALSILIGRDTVILCSDWSES